MSIIRRARTSAPFTTILNAVVEDRSLSAEALGLLVYLVGKPDNWKVMPSQLKDRFGCGRDRIYRIMSELIEAGYMQREQSSGEDGKFGDANYLVCDEKLPLTENADAEANEFTVSGKSDTTKETKQKRNKDSSAAKKADQSYSEDFEIIWKQYPRTKNTSKKEAWNYYRMMGDDKQDQVRRAVPLFAAAMRAEGRTEDKILHMIRFLRNGIYETVAAPAGAPIAGAGPAKPFWETATPKAWSSALLLWSQNWNWNKIWGPEPGQPGCRVPQYILDRFDLRYRAHLYSVEDFQALKERVENRERSQNIAGQPPGAAAP